MLKRQLKYCVIEELSKMRFPYVTVKNHRVIRRSVLCDIPPRITHFMQSWSPGEKRKNGKHGSVISVTLNRLIGNIAINDEQYNESRWQESIWKSIVNMLRGIAMTATSTSNKSNKMVARYKWLERMAKSVGGCFRDYEITSVSQ